MSVTANKLLAGALFIAPFFGACRKDPLNNLSNDETRVYITNYDTTANFASYSTFSISDSVAIIQDNQYAGRSVQPFDGQVINAITQMMTQRGYQSVSNKSSPDLAINVSRVYTSSTAYFNYSDYWDYYGTYWDPYSYGYGGYGYYDPYAVGSYTINTGGLEIDLLDLKNATAHGNKIEGLWTGLAQGEQVFDANNAAGEVSALFGESPYLQK